jgi:PD-(D/E)XK nuclease superfamily
VKAAVADGLLTFEPAAVPLDSISPTRYVAIRQCGLREIWAAIRAPQLLPSFPAARLGSVIHRLLEEAGQGAFASGDAMAVDQRWKDLVTDAERTMLDGWLERQFVPLSRSVADFEVRRIQARERALELGESVARARDRPASTASDRLGPLHGCEIPVSTNDRRVRGRIDAVALDRDGPVVRDYKSGAIFETAVGHEHTLKEAYEIQLRMYAALYAETSGTWPARLEVVPILGRSETVAFDRDECLGLVESARDTLDTVNDAIQLNGPAGVVQGRLARPRPEVCGHCPYRPGCLPYRVARKAGGGPWPHDLWGRLMSIAPLAADRLIMELDCDDGVIRIRGLGSKERHPALGILEPGDWVAVFNARPTGSPSTFSESSFTVIYKVPEGCASESEAALPDD